MSDPGWTSDIPTVKTSCEAFVDFSGQRGFVMIRFVSLNLFIAIFTILYCVLGLILSLFGASPQRIHFWVAVPWARVILCVCGIRVKATGKENVDPAVPRVYMTNHQSYFDIFALLAHLPVDFKFIMKQELMRIPILGPTMRRAGYIGIERKNPRKAVRSMNEAAKKIREGVSVLIFPEGTRSEDGRLQAFKKGGFNLALRSGCDIVPIAIGNSYRIVPKGSLKIRKGTFSLRVGRPIPVKGYSRREIPLLMERVREAILKQMEESDAHGEAERTGPAGPRLSS